CAHAAALRATWRIVTAASSEALLAVNELAAGEHNDNPLDAWISRERPEPERPLDVDLSGKLRGIGWALTDPEGRHVAQVRTGRRYDFRIYWEVLDTLSSNWRTFI